MGVPQQIHQMSPSTYNSVSRRRLQWKRNSQGPYASGGRSGREGGHAEGSSGGPPHRSAPFYSPKKPKG